MIFFPSIFLFLTAISQKKIVYFNKYTYRVNCFKNFKCDYYLMFFKHNILFTLQLVFNISHMQVLRKFPPPHCFGNGLKFWKMAKRAPNQFEWVKSWLKEFSFRNRWFSLKKEKKSSFAKFNKGSIRSFRSQIFLK